MERERDVKALKELISKVMPRRKLGYMRKKFVITAGGGGCVQGQS
jgi:hypothetical protein